MKSSENCGPRSVRILDSEKSVHAFGVVYQDLFSRLSHMRPSPFTQIRGEKTSQIRISPILGLKSSQKVFILGWSWNLREVMATV